MIQFNNIILHNFGSYHHADIDLQNKGFCLVSGENNFKQDNALSNGSGKSFIWSGICYAITGATIQGLKSDLKNIYVDENDAYVIFKNGEAFILNMNIKEYEKGTIFNHDPLRTRKLLMNKREILKYEQKCIKDGYTVVPTKLYLKKGMAKIEIALAKGKKLYDKRETIKERDDKRNIDKAIKRN